MKISGLDSQAFLKKYRHQANALQQADLKWEDLVEIHNAHWHDMPRFEAAARSVTDGLMEIPGIHALSCRVKEAEHVVEKIIREKLTGATAHNYFEKVRDL